MGGSYDKKIGLWNGRNVLNETKETEKREETEINEGFGGVESKSFSFAWRQRQSVSSLGTLWKTPPYSNTVPCW